MVLFEFAGGDEMRHPGRKPAGTESSKFPRFFRENRENRLNRGNRILEVSTRILVLHPAGKVERPPVSRYNPRMEHRNSDPRHVDISLSQGVKIAWADGHESQYSLDYLRQNCPCASCTVAGETPAAPPNSFPMYKPVLRLTSADTVGRYAVRFLWADGHTTGIYSFDHLREICPCPECKGQ